MFDILIVTLILLMQVIPHHDFVIVCNPKVSIHCTFSHDSDDETEEWPIPTKREVSNGKLYGC